MCFSKKKMPTAFCSLEDAYGGNWGNKQTHQQQQQKQPQQEEEKQIKEQPTNTKFENTNEDIRSFCPNCKSCVKSNDELQQKIINQIVWPRPRWIPQMPDAYVPYDPYNRYWTNMYPMVNREDFGNSNTINFQNDNVTFLLNVIIFILSVLLVIQIIEIFMKIKKEE